VKNAARERKFLTGQSRTSERHDHGTSHGQDCGNHRRFDRRRVGRVGPDIPQITEPVIVKYVIDLAQLGLL